MSLTAAERETIITLNDEDGTAHIWTAQRPWITKLKRNPLATLLDEGIHDGSVWAEFEIKKSMLSIRGKEVKREMTEEQRQAAADRLAAVRATRQDQTS